MQKNHADFQFSAIHVYANKNDAIDNRSGGFLKVSEKITNAQRFNLQRMYILAGDQINSSVLNNCTRILISTSNMCDHMKSTDKY